MSELTGPCLKEATSDELIAEIFCRSYECAITVSWKVCPEEVHHWGQGNPLKLDGMIGGLAEEVLMPTEECEEGGEEYWEEEWDDEED